MWVINFLLCVSVVLVFSCEKKRVSILDVPKYKFIYDFSEKMKEKHRLILYCYGVNINSKPQKKDSNVSDFSIDYVLYKSRYDTVTLEEARSLLVFVVENLLSEINSNYEIRDNLDFFPFTIDSIRLVIYFKDENKINLGGGIAKLRFSKGNIKYEKYDIEEYREVYPAIGKHSIIHQESYQDALDIVKGNVHAEQFQNQK